ncbi:protein IQ-DOMAIN 9 isoform X1 [Ziziphus jujuba]|uniref:Protein IQ-DOMAIN 9 isoform X1 n=4 Tax=Ziziphus jujuba TaxID=326968 RepID=A0A6P6GFX0_ZIZJJ|nr:protein IQ-DOMAIN 9 isoform X1 [Ziziphus jujuba]XP_015873669.3 protein IQ-DOMAIN 9 isoform X1 [Ziziphus jujuba]XP_024933014.3 protein IQ-DOMAIN 9 isoform X1 [Ziziphus jujuba]
MGSGNWIKTIIRLKKTKIGSSKKGKKKGLRSFANGGTCGTNGCLDMPIEDIAATRIQTAFRAYMARKALRRLRGTVRLQALKQGYPVHKQATTTLGHLHSWCKIQAQIRARRLCMVTEGRIKQKKQENQLKLEARLHGLEVEWCGGAETMDEILGRIYQREEAAVKRERAMAYAFSHQWRANCSQSQGLGSDELGKANWGWSWKERWIAARPWESRVPTKFISPKKVKSKQDTKVGKTVNSPSPKTPTPKAPTPVKVPSSNGKRTMKPRRLSFPSSEKSLAVEGNTKTEEANTKKEELVS